MATLKLNDIETTASRKVFDACDLNGDGYIDPHEFHLLLNALDGDVSPAESQLDFEIADTAGDGYIEFREFAQWWTN